MRRKKIEGILCLTGMLLLTGCGTKAYDLTEAEESQIVNYAVHVVSKHNSYQKDGLVYVDQSAEETEPEEQPEEAPEEISRYAALNVTEDDIDMLAALAWHEARGEPFDGQVAVVLTALNRCLSPEFPDTVEEVVFQKYGDVWQFSPAPYLWTAEPTQTQYDAVYTALHDTDYILPAEAVFFSTKAYNDNIVAVIGNHIFCSIEEVTQ